MVDPNENEVRHLTQLLSSSYGGHLRPSCELEGFVLVRSAGWSRFRISIAGSDRAQPTDEQRAKGRYGSSYDTEAHFNGGKYPDGGALIQEITAIGFIVNVPHLLGVRYSDDGRSNGSVFLSAITFESCDGNIRRTRHACNVHCSEKDGKNDRPHCPRVHFRRVNHDHWNHRESQIGPDVEACCDIAAVKQEFDTDTFTMSSGIEVPPVRDWTTLEEYQKPVEESNDNAA